jgi:hypothetical protein
MKRLQWHETFDPAAPESPREGAGVIRSSADGVGCLGPACDPENEEATEDLSWRFSREDLSLLEDFAEFLSPGSVAGASGEPDRDFKERLRRRLWRLHVGIHVRRGQTH